MNDPYHFTVREYVIAGIAAVIGAPVLWLVLVIFLTALGQ